MGFNSVFKGLNCNRNTKVGSRERKVMKHRDFARLTWKTLGYAQTLYTVCGETGVCTNYNHQLTFGPIDLFVPFKGVFFLPSPFSQKLLSDINHLNAELNHICHLLALLRARHILHISSIRVKQLFIMLCAFFWVIPRRLNFICRRFGTHCSIFIGG